MSFVPRSLPQLLVAIFVAAFWIESASASTGINVVVQLQNGRQLTGEVDSRTDARELWLHSTQPSIVILCSVPWSEVISARISGQPEVVTDIRSSLSKLKTQVPVATFRQPPQPLATDPAGCVRSDAECSGDVDRVVSLEIVPRLANWDHDVEPDGLEVRVLPTTAEGRVAKIHGFLTLRLIGRRSPAADRLESRSGLGVFSNGGAVREYAMPFNNTVYVELGRWNELLSSADLTTAGYVLRLPFRQISPDLDLDITLNGQLDARLNAQGQQFYEATSPIQLRAFSPLREELQLNRGTRYFPGER